MSENNEKANEERQKNADPGSQRIIVIGASTGGFNAIRTIVKDLPPDLDASVFIVWHMSPDIRGVLPQVLNKDNKIYAAHAYDKEEIMPNRIYVAPPDHHLLVEEGQVRVTHGPKENRFRPAVDPLFRSAAYTYGGRVIGIVLSGALDDGTAGLWTIKSKGGIAMVQDPDDAEVASMPRSALAEVEVDYCLPANLMAGVLTRLSKEKLPQEGKTGEDDRTKVEIQIAAENNTLAMKLFSNGKLTEFTCPECHGVLSRIIDGNIMRYRCHTGHAFSVDTLLAAISENIESSLYNAIRGIDESMMLLNHIGDHFAEANSVKLAAVYFKKAKEARERAETVRKAVLSHEQLTKDFLAQEALNQGSKTD
ncbi:MAG: chemotaxis protein CheB [Williamsia sp.]|nr:chemotaxis protein CheB [Williamsia sp.]